MPEDLPAARFVPITPGETLERLATLLGPGGYRWAIYDRPERTLYMGPQGTHTHMGVADESRVLRHAPDYYRPGGNVVGGFVCRSLDGEFYFDPFSGTFPGTDEGVREAEVAFAEICLGARLSCESYDGLTRTRRALGGARPLNR